MFLKTSCNNLILKNKLSFPFSSRKIEIDVYMLHRFSKDLPRSTSDFDPILGTKRNEVITKDYLLDVFQHVFERRGEGGKREREKKEKREERETQRQ